MRDRLKDGVLVFSQDFEPAENIVGKQQGQVRRLELSVKDFRVLSACERVSALMLASGGLIFSRCEVARIRLVVFRSCPIVL